MKKAVLYFTMLFSISICSQTKECDCSAVFNELTQKVEDNYIALAQLRLAGESTDFEKRI